MNWASRGISTSLLGYSLLTAFLFGPVLNAAAQSPGTFMATGNMTTPRVGYTATLLPGGKVLIAGGEVIVGFASGTPLASAELYDPSTGAFSPTGNMTTPRDGGTATLLADGRVLIAGGIGILSGTKTPLASAELYDPSTGTFTATGSMTTTRSGPATLLYDGRVLMVGDDDSQLYDPATGTFTVTGGFAGAYSLPEVDTATLLPDGTVLITGYDISNGGPLVELYDPGTGTFSLTGGVSGPIEWWSNENTATLLRNGKVLIEGNYEDDELKATALLYDPSTRIFSGVGYTTAPHLDSPATLLPDGEVLIAGGELIFGVGSVATDLYDPATGMFSAGANMAIGRCFNSATLLPNGTVLIAGGLSGPDSTSSAELYVPSVLTPPLVVTDLQFDLAVVPPGASYSVTISGSGLTAETLFDVRFTSPGSSLSAVVLNWQSGIVESHYVPAGLGTGTWTINGVRAHQGDTDHTGDFNPVSATLTVAPVPAPVVTGLQFDGPSVMAGGSYLVTLSGSNLTPQTFFDVQFTAPESNTSYVALNWQTGLAASHAVPLDTPPGTWIINGVRAHEIETDHTGNFFPVSGTITVSP